jgi:hypothetical protein
LSRESKCDAVDVPMEARVGGVAMDLSGYAVAPLREGDLTRCRGSGNGLTPILLTAGDGSLVSFKRLEHEHALEDPGGKPLDRLLHRALTISEVLQIAIASARALAHVHERGLVHKDVKPRKRPHPQAPEVIAGTLAYMAPEQTGGMNRSVDSRTPNLDEARSAVESIIKSGHRAGEITRRVRTLLDKTDANKAPLQINNVNDAIACSSTNSPAGGCCCAWSSRPICLGSTMIGASCSKLSSI